MKLITYSILMALLVGGCNSETPAVAQQPSCTGQTKPSNPYANIDPEFSQENGFIESATHWNTIRIIAIGMQQPTDLQSSYPELFNELIAAGYEIVGIGAPNFNTVDYDGDGSMYRAKFIARLYSAMDWADRTYGIASEYIVMGASRYGLHTMIAAASMPEIHRYIAFNPAVKIGILTDFTANPFNVIDVPNYMPHFDPTRELDTLQNKKGLETYNTSDYRVEWALAAGMAYELNRRVAGSLTAQVFSSGGHYVPADDFSYVVNWLNER